MTELTDRMRTCAAFILDRDKAKDPWAAELVALDAVDLLIEASNLLSVHAAVAAPGGPPDAPLGRPPDVVPGVEILTPASVVPASVEQPTLWVDPGGPLPGLKQSGTLSPRACPQCDSRAHKRVFRVGRQMMLQCPVCATQWPFQPSGARHG